MKQPHRLRETQERVSSINRKPLPIQRDRVPVNLDVLQPRPDPPLRVHLELLLRLDLGVQLLCERRRRAALGQEGSSVVAVVLGGAWIVLLVWCCGGAGDVGGGLGHLGLGPALAAAAFLEEAQDGTNLSLAVAGVRSLSGPIGLAAGGDCEGCGGEWNECGTWVAQQLAVAELFGEGV